jgi:CSLREA domain-containing protein
MTMFDTQSSNSFASVYPNPIAITFIDAGLDDVASLVSEFSVNTEVYVLDAGQEAIAQITQVLGGRSNISAVNIVSHGSNGTLQLGGESISDLSGYDDELQLWGNALTEDADILLYGCSVAEGAIGQRFVSQLAALTRADVAASTNLTGSAALGGDWDLEFATGSIEASDVLSDWAQAAYQTVLATYTVTTTDDIVDAGDGVLSLREAIDQANAANADTINFSVSGTITLTRGQLGLTDSALTTINGANTITISGNNAGRIFQIGSGATVELNGLTLTGGNATVYAVKDGGDIFSQGAILTVNNSTFSGSSARYGGAIVNYDGILTVNNSTFSGNSATAGGGAIDSSSLIGAASLIVTNSTFSGNSTAGDGGAINNDSLNGDGTASLRVNNSTISGNSASDDGGGIKNLLGAFTINNSLVAGNSASRGREINDFSSIDTIGSNNLFGYSGNSGIQSLSPSFRLNYITPTVGLNQILNTTLANNGGPTRTLALLPTLTLTVQANKTVTLLEDASSTSLGITAPTAPNPAVNAGSNRLLPANTNFDQRGTGFARIVGGTVDIGAFELQTPLPTPVITITGLPDSTKGAVYLADGTTAVTLNQSLTTTQLAGLVFKPVANANGSAGTFSYSVTDGTNTQSQTITLNITSVNDAPVVNLASATQSITSSNSLISGITLSDVDAGNNPVVVTLKVNSGILNVVTTPNVTIGSNNTGTVTLTGTIANINTALTNLRYSGSNNFSGNDSLNITVNDQGNTGSEGAKSDSKAIALNVSRDLGSLPLPQLISGSVDPTDPVDVYQVTFTSPVTLSATLAVLSGDADLTILDSSGNAIATSNNAGLIAEFLQRQLAAGTYRIQVRRFTGSTNYNLLLSKF